MTIANLLAWAAQSLVLVSVAALMPAVLRVRSARAQLIVFQLVLFGMLALPLLQPWKHPVIAAPLFVSEPAPVSAAPIEPVGEAPFDWERTAMYVLAVGIVARGTWLILGLLRLRRYRRYAEPLPGDPRFAVSTDVTSAVTFGLWRPVVLVPPMFLEMPEEQRRAIATHELIHVERRDWLFCIAEEIAATLMWFHPAVWFLLARIRALREQVVDAEALALTEEKEPYVEALLRMAEARPMLDVAAAPLFLRKRDLTDRVKTILKGHSMSVRRIVFSYACVATVLAVATVSVSAFPLIGAPMQNEMEVRGTLTSVDTFSLPQPLRSQVEARVVPYRNAPFSTDLMLRIKAGIAAMDGRIVQNWVQEAPNLYSVSFSYDTSEKRNQPVLVRIDTSRLPEPLRSQVEARMSSFVNAPFTESLMRGIQSAVRSIHPKIAYRWSNEPGGNEALTFIYDQPDDSWQPIFGVLARIDVSVLPEPVRTQLEQRLAKYLNAPYTNALMREISRETFAVVPKHAITWRRESPGVFSLTISNEPPPGSEPAVSIGAPQPDFPSDGEKQIRVGGAVQANKLRHSVPPVYPPLALQARIQGVVRFNVQIAKDGRIKAMQMVSGHPLLVQAAKDALAQYEYETTLLNGEPVQVITQVDVNFTLN